MSERNPALSGGIDPRLYLGATSRTDALTEFEQRRQELDPAVADALADAGPEAVEAYGSVRLYHNTLASFVPSILAEGLHAGSELAVPDPEDVAFAEELFKAKGNFDPNSERQFDRYIKGTPSEREPGVFFYAKRARDFESFNQGYGRPERLFIIAQEMSYVMAMDNDTYTEAEQRKAHGLFLKYSAIVNGKPGEHVTVLRANPFNPNIFNSRLSNLPNIEPENLAALPIALPSLGVFEFEGVYVPGSVEPKDLELLDVEIQNTFQLAEDQIDPTRSRFFYTPQR